MVQRYRWLISYSMILMIVLFSMALLVFSGKAMSFYKVYVKQTSTIKGIQSLNEASNAIIKELSRDAKNCGIQQYDILMDVINGKNAISISEKEVDRYYRSGYYVRLEELIGYNPEEISSYLNRALENNGIDSVKVTDGKNMAIIKEVDDSGEVLNIKLQNVTLEYTDPVVGTRTDTLSYSFGIPKATFYTGNDEIFDYCMIANKGIYITGATSSIIGDLYAGGHNKDDFRDTEKAYGEVNNYGGLNILSTQLGVNARRIVSEEDININGSFVIFSGEDGNELVCFGKHLNDIDGFAKETMYFMDGIFYSTIKNDESVMTTYNDYINSAKESLGKLNDIEIYYDSKNEEGGFNPYRVLMSDSDIEIKNDFTGIVLTPCNVIIDNGVNFEGLILCGDRIYVRGNNNIVANRDVIRAIMDFEENVGTGMRAIDYIDGIKYKEIIDPDYYVKPYR